MALSLKNISLFFILTICLTSCGLGQVSNHTEIITANIKSNPDGAKVYRKLFADYNDKYVFVGTTPFKDTFKVTYPYPEYVYKFTKKGYEDSSKAVPARLKYNVNGKVKVFGALSKISFISQDTPKTNFAPDFKKTKYSVIGTGTGWFTSTGYIITNYHVVKGFDEIIIRFNDPNINEYKAMLLVSDKHNDLAVLQITTSDKVKIKGLKLSRSSAKLGESVFTLGFPRTNVMGNNLKVTNGIVSALSGIQDDPRFIQTTVTIQPGNSGGPLVNMSGEVLGVTTATLRTMIINDKLEIPQNVNYAIKSAYINPLISTLPTILELHSENISKSNLDELIPILKNSIVQIIVKKRNNN